MNTRTNISDTDAGAQSCAERRFDRKPLRIFAGYYRPHWKLFAADMVCAFLISGADLFFPLMTKYTIDKLLPEQLYRFFFIMIVLMVALYLLRSAFSYFVTYWGHTVGAYIETDMRRDLFTHLQKLSFSFYDSHRTGHIMSRVTNDLFEVTELAHHGPEDLFISLVTLIGSFFILLAIRWELALVLFAVIPFIVIHTVRSRKKMTASSRKVKEKMSEINASLESSISGARTAKAFTNEAYESEKFSDGNSSFRASKKGYYRTMAGFHSGLEFMMNSLNVVVIAVGGFLIMRGRMSLSDLIAANLFVAAFLQPIRRLANFVEQYTTGMAGFNRFVELMRVSPDITDVPGAVPLTAVKGDISYRHVYFSYDHDVSVLRDVNLDIPAGKTVALVGPSGGGKTTLCHLLPRFYEIDSGLITIDGKDIRSVTLESLRRNIGIVQQDVFLFAGTVRENIAYGRIGSSDDEIIAAARKAEIHDDVMRMPNGYDTIVGERGIKLSGGQKQRVSIARIFLKNPPVLILDEATSALDTATEIKIQHAFDELARGRTTLVIAHRLSTIKNADRIAVIDDEGIREQGTHDELLERGGLYARLYRAQFGDDDRKRDSLF